MIIGVVFFFFGCSDDDNATVIQSKQELQNVKCMRLVVFPPDKFLSDAAHKMYHFSKNCSYTLTLSQKSGIACNSNQNASQKILANFPSGYIRLELTKGDKTIFSYYKDLTHKVEKRDIQKAFETLLDK